MRFKLFLAITFATIGQMYGSIVTAAETSQLEKLVFQNDLASNVALDRQPIVNARSASPTMAISSPEFLAKRTPKRKKKVSPSRVKQRLGKPIAPPQRPVNPVPTPSPSTSSDAPNVKRVLVSEIVIKSPKGQLDPALADKVRQAISVKTGQPTTREELQQDLNAIRGLGAFSAVEIIPEDTAKGVKLSFIVTPYGVLRQVQIKTLPANSSSILPAAEVDKIFQSQYGKTLNAQELQAAIKKLNQLYQSQGYNLAQVVDVEELSEDGKLTLVIAEGLIEDVQVRFLTKDGSPLDENKKPIQGATRPFIITREAELQPGKVFNRTTAEKDLRRIYGLGLFDDVRVSFVPGTDPAKVVLQLNVIERKTASILAGGGISSTNGVFGSVSFNQQNLGGNAQKLGAELQVGSRDLLFDFNFTDPWIAGDPNRTSYNVNAFQRRSLSLVFDGGKTPVFLPSSDPNVRDVPRVLRQGGGVTFSRPLNGNPYADSDWRASLGLQYQRVSIRDAGGGTIVPRDAQGNDLSFSKTGQDDLFMLQLGVTQDLRNNFFDPSQGSLLKVGLDQSIPIGSGNIAMTRLRGSYTNYVPVKLINFSPGSQSLVFNVQGGTVIGDLPPYEAFSLGGTSSVRGFEDGDVGSGRSYLQATAEYRFPIVSIVGGGLFVDYGTDLGTGNSVPGNPAGVRGKPGNGLGYGAGVRIQSPLGSIRIDYALNNRGEGRVQFGIGERY
jgi:outer membrane protein insertion porin family